MQAVKPELLAPGGSLEKIKIALLYGADAVYTGGTVFGLRKFADNLDLDELKEALDFAHSRSKKIYLVLNGFAHNSDIEKLKPYLDELQTLSLDGFIISDMGVMQLAKERTTIPLHVSTQASVTNWIGCKFWKDAGAKRVILAREVTIDECREIKENLEIELEVFIHGAMCASYSGKCVISNYTSGRDSNRGGCVQSCRHLFDIQEGDSTHIMNAKDLMAIRQVPDLFKAGLDSLKIEGRMKSNMYVANCVSIYRDAIDQYAQSPKTYSEFIQKFESELNDVSNRTFASGGLEHRPSGESIHYAFSGYAKHTDFVGTVKEVLPGKGVFVEVKVPFKKGDILELFSQTHQSKSRQVDELFDLSGQSLEAARSSSMVWLPWIDGVQAYDIVRKKV